MGKAERVGIRRRGRTLVQRRDCRYGRVTACEVMIDSLESIEPLDASTIVWRAIGEPRNKDVMTLARSPT